MPAAREVAGERFTLIVDGGIRRGSDVLKALALGADAVLAGHAIIYGIAAAGRAGAARAIDILREEIDRTLALLAAQSAQDLDSSFPATVDEVGRTLAQPESHCG